MTKTKYILSIVLTTFIVACTQNKTISTYHKFNPLKYVDVFVGTGTHGHTFPGATRPNAMVQFSPDTHLLGWEASSGYWFPDTTVYAFSLTHLSGTGIGDMGDVALLPYSNKLKDSREPYAIMNKHTEKASPGFYSVELKDQGISVALTSTNRVGLMRLDYQNNHARNILLNLSHILQPNWGHKIKANDLYICNDSTIKGTYYTSGWAYDHRISYCIRFNTKIDSIEVKQNDKTIGGIGTDLHLDTAKLQVFIHFASGKNPVYIKVGISPVSANNALLNMQKELPGWNFDIVKKESEDIWRKTLSSIIIQTSDTAVLTNFYTALYHINIAPYNYQDINGDYRGVDKRIHHTNSEDGHYTVFSIWDTYRALNPLLTIINPQKELKYVRSLISDYKDGSILPKWPLASNYTGCMPAYHTVSLMADLISKGLAKKEDLALWTKAAVATSIYRPDLAKKFAGTREADLITKYPLLKQKYSFIPCDSLPQSVSWGQEMAYDDWCIAQIARAAGFDSIANRYDKYGLYYKRYWDSTTGFMRPITAKGTFKTPFNPRWSDHDHGDYTEGDAYQWSFYAPQDMQGYIKLIGGKDSLEKHLDTLFYTSSRVDGPNKSGDITGLIGQYAHGNEPSQHIAYLYNYTHHPYKGQLLIDSILYNFYTPTPAGIIGNEDCGQMSAWYVMSALGFYQICPGKPIFFLGRPLVDRAEIKIPKGIFTIIVHNNSRQNKYIQKAAINGKTIKNLQFYYSDIKPGGQLDIYMGAIPQSLHQ